MGPFKRHSHKPAYIYSHNTPGYVLISCRIAYTFVLFYLLSLLTFMWPLTKNTLYNNGCKKKTYLKYCPQ